MKYYLYISDSKVDMLLPQVPLSEKKKVATEFKLDLKLLSGSRRTEIVNMEERIVRLQAVVDFLHTGDDVGPLDSGKPWLYGTALATAMTFKLDKLVFFFGKSESTVFGLGGSIHHVIGYLREGSAYVSYSFLPTLLNTLRVDIDFIDQLPDSKKPSYLCAGISGEETGEPWLRVIQHAANTQSGPQQEIEFLARRLISGKEAGQTVILATPLYVASAE